MKYWKEKESNPVEKMEFWKGEYITKLEPNEIFVMGTNPSGIHGAGAAKAGLKFGAKILQGRGLVGSTYGLITKNLEGKEGFVEKATGIVYHKAGFRSVSPEQIRDNIDEMYAVARQPEHKDKKFLITYQYNTWANGSPKKSLNGYDSQEILELFAKDKDVPPNIVFHESYKPHLEKLYINQNKQSTGELVVYEDGKSVDIKEENIVWTIDEDERNLQGRHGAGAAKKAVEFGAAFGKARGFLGGQTYGIITKSLQAGFTEKATGITYAKEGFKSVSAEQIRTNIDELYSAARQSEHQDKKFLITYQYETYPNGSPKASLNGYTSQEMLEMFVHDDIPSNIVFHDSYAPHLEKLLKPAVEAAPTYTYFFHLTSPFSNFHPARFEYKDLTFISNEQFMMYSKAKTFKDEVVAEKIMNIHREFEISPGVFKDEHSKNCYQLLDAFKSGNITVDQILKNKEYVEAWNTIHKKIKALGRQVSNYDDAVWNEKRVPVVYFGAKLKFSQNPHLYDKLMSTGGSIMVEASPYDKIWGTGLNAADSAKVGPLNWPGQNLLGHVLTELKKYFVLELTKPNKPKM